MDCKAGLRGVAARCRGPAHGALQVPGGAVQAGARPLVYLSNVETLARKFVEEKHDALAALRAGDGGFLAFWASLEPRRRRQMACRLGRGHPEGARPGLMRLLGTGQKLPMPKALAGAAV